MKPIYRLLLLAAMLMLALSPATSTGMSASSTYQTGFTFWRGADLSAWVGTGAKYSKGTLVMGPGAATGVDPAGQYQGRNFYNGGSYTVGEATGPVVNVPFSFSEAIASWDVDTPAGTWVETLVRAQIGSRWTKWYNLGVWAADDSTIQRHSVNLQGDADGYVATDTLVLAKGKVPASALQLKVRLFSASGRNTPVVRGLSLTYSTTAPSKVDQPSIAVLPHWETVLNVPTCSQMVYPDGGNVWCSPTSTSMVVGFYGADDGTGPYSTPCENRVRRAVTGTYDWVYDGNGNWPFNTAYAASLGLEGYVARYTRIDDLEPWIQKGVPVVMSIAWGKNDLTNAPIPSSSGHLIVLVGFDRQGNAVVNDPAAASNDQVRRTYNRAELESAWITNSGGTVYLIFPPGTAISGY